MGRGVYANYYASSDKRRRKFFRLFENNQTISDLKQFKTLRRLFKEQCEIVDSEDGQHKIQATLPDLNEDQPANSISPAQEGIGTKQTIENGPSEQQTARDTIEVKKPQAIGSDSLQSPTDTDATYGHKGKGYEYQVAQTCDQQNPFQVITETHLNAANESDQTQTIAMIEELYEADLKFNRCD